MQYFVGMEILIQYFRFNSNLLSIHLPSMILCMFKKRFAVYFTLFLLSISVKAQLSFDPMQFSTDLEAYIQKSGSKSAIDAGADFIGFYTANQISPAQKTQVIKLTNQLVDRKIAISVLENYLRAMSGLIENNQVSKLDKWHKAAVLSFTQSKDDFATFAQISKNVFQDHIVAKVGGMTWVTDNAEVDMDLKSEDPAFMFKNMNLFCYTLGDTIQIKNTGGKYFAANNQWVGNGGTYWWTRVGLDSAAIYADLRRYTIDFATGNIRADTAMLHYPALFSEAIAGVLIDRPMAQSAGSRSMYPQFQSHRTNFTNIQFGKAKLTGSFGLKGRVLVGKGVDSAKAELLFAYRGKPIFKIQAKEFMVREGRVGSKKAAMVMYLDKDSIYHPQIEFTYRLTDDFMHIYRNDEGISSAPFYDSYHNMEFYVDQVTWDLTNPKVDLDMVNDNEPAKFESVNYFRDLRYERVQGILDYNPLQRIKLYCDRRNVKSFSLYDYAPNYKSNVSDLRIQMIALNDRGYIDFDVEKDYVYVKRKLYDYVNAHFGKTDYDAIAFFSIIKRYPNASISLINNDLQVQGVPKFQFSDSQNVYIVPKDQILTVKKNRNMDLAGRIRAGKVDFYGSGFAFDYHTFQVRLNNVDSMKFHYYDDATGSDIPIKSVLQNVFGTLAIDHPGNKSGRKDIPGYPIFKSDVGSKVYYDKPTTQYGVYDRNRFYFDVDPFTIDSLSDLDFETLSLDGTMISGGIMPDLRYHLYLQPDRSLGFKIEKSEAGYPLYGEKGRGYVALSLSDEGYFGKGELRYLSSMSESEQFTFLLDSMNAFCSSFKNDRTEKYPDAFAMGVHEHWVPYMDTMYITNTAEKIQVSNNRVKLDGTLMLTPQRLAAKGVNHIRDAQLVSTNFWMKPDVVYADTANFRMINYMDSTKFAFYSGSVQANVDLNNATGKFVYNEEGVNSMFNYNLYAGSFKQFQWMMDKQTLDFDSHQENGKDVSYLLSTRGSQDSLKFVSGTTTLQLKDFTLTAKKIPYIPIADAWVYPDSGKVIIRADAIMDELQRAEVIADTATKYHKIEQVRMTINGRFNIYATGKYQYTDSRKNIQRFFLDEIKVDEQHRLYGKTNIPDSANFYVGNHISFKGNAILRSVQKNLEYEGFFLARHDLPYPKTDWFRASAIINPDSVYLSVDTMGTNTNRQVLMTGLNISNDSTHIYPAFFSRKRNGSDPELIKLSGTLQYNEALGIYKLGPYDKVFGAGLKGNYMELSAGKKNIYYEGRFKLGFEGSAFDLQTAGNGIYSYKDTTFRMKLMVMLNFPFPKSAMRILYDTLINQSSNASNADFDEALLTKGFSDLMKNEKDVFKVLSELPDKTIPAVDELQKSFLFSAVSFRWNQATRSFVSEGDLSLNAVDNLKIERKYYGRIEITKKRSGDDYTMYLQTPEGSWYFFKYQRGMLFTIGSDPLYNQNIKDNFEKVSKQQENFSLRPANIGDRNKFVRNMKLQK